MDRSTINRLIDRNKKMPIHKYNGLHNYGIPQGIKELQGTIQNKQIKLVYQVNVRPLIN